jgi:hypothetical protein
MKHHSIVTAPRLLAALCGIALAAGIVGTRAKAEIGDQRTVLTVQGQPIQVRDTVLEPGTYVLKLLYSNTGSHNVVHIYKANENGFVADVIAVPTSRPENQRVDKPQFTFWETPTGTARAMRTWWFGDSVMGEEFAYPAHPKELVATSSVSTMPAQPEAAVTPASAPEKEESAPAEVAENTAAPEPAAEPAPSNEPNPMTAAAEPQSAPNPPANPPAQMPKTASPFPLIGLCGMLAMSLAGLFRLARLS